MKPEDIFENEKNFKSRLEFVKFWAQYVRAHSNDDWSSQQCAFIDSVIRGANQDVSLYKKVKKIAP